MYNNKFVEQVKLLLKILPVLRAQDTFALKGGTAINFLFQNLPRLSVDIDLTYTRLDSRDIAIENLEKGLQQIKADIIKLNKAFVVKEQLSRGTQLIIKLFVFHNNTMVKIEPNHVMRGTVYPVEKATLCQGIRDQFGLFLDEIPTLAYEELYAGKICAALNRQHPRDLFDVKLLLENGGITKKIRQTFVVYLACNPRPMHELLKPNRLDIAGVYENEFLHMTNFEVTIDELLDTREALISTIITELTDNEREFLLSVKKGEPQFSLLPFNNLDKLPALKWKVINIQKMSVDKAGLMLTKLKAVLNM
jgi:predicted nucleotidyltransferase component of viral defense system